jgi:hypothetical protein
MLDKFDVLTADAFGLKKRGRPVTGNALTSAQRMAKKRERDSLVIKTARYQADYSVLSTQGLMQAMQDAITNKNPVDARKVAGELIKRAKFD